mmetsp:Transcript_124701/g.248975  ORF Transcript_124701/g.248975 Transcript_124701/m.248975 type:complete len:206 (+) Transcript_124701:174-791(+)
MLVPWCHAAIARGVAPREVHLLHRLRCSSRPKVRTMVLCRLGSQPMDMPCQQLQRRRCTALKVRLAVRSDQVQQRDLTSGAYLNTTPATKRDMLLQSTPVMRRRSVMPWTGTALWSRTSCLLQTAPQVRTRSLRIAACLAMGHPVHGRMSIGRTQADSSTAGVQSVEPPRAQRQCGTARIPWYTRRSRRCSTVSVACGCLPTHTG